MSGPPQSLPGFKELSAHDQWSVVSSTGTGDTSDASLGDFLAEAGLQEFGDELSRWTVAALLSKNNDELEDVADAAGMKKAARHSLFQAIAARRTTVDPDLQKCLCEAGLQEFSKQLSEWTLTDLLSKTEDELEDVADLVGMKRTARDGFLLAVKARRLTIDHALIECLTEVGLEMYGRRLSEGWTFADLLSKSSDELEDVADSVGMKKNARKSFLKAVVARQDPLHAEVIQFLAQAGLQDFGKQLSAWKFADLLSKSSDELEDVADTVGMKRVARERFLQAVESRQDPLGPALLKCLKDADLEEFSKELCSWKFADFLSKTNEELEDVADSVGMKRTDRNSFVDAIEDFRDPLQDAVKQCLLDAGLVKRVGGLSVKFDVHYREADDDDDEEDSDDD